MTGPSTSSQTVAGGRATNIPRPSYASISLYAPVRAPVEIDLSDNTNQWGAPPSVARTLSSLDPALVTQYPTQPMVELETALTRFIGIPDVDAVVTGCGSDDLLDCMMRALAEPGDVIVHAQPTFSMIPYFARTNGLIPVAVPFADNWAIDVDAMLSPDPRLVYLCAPNNPTGTGISEDTVRRIVDNSSGIVILDEAYAEFATSTWARRAGNEQRLVVTRTLSKAFGLAGLRIGYAIGAPELVTEIAKARGPYKVNAVAERIATTVLNEDVEWMRARAHEAVESREWLMQRLAADGFAPIRSEANFVLLPFPDAAACAARLAARGVLVRAFTALPGVGDALRLTVAPLPVLVKLLGMLNGVTSEMRGTAS
jgi:histidinol-phosphate aminotransferase